MNTSISNDQLLFSTRTYVNNIISYFSTLTFREKFGEKYTSRNAYNQAFEELDRVSVEYGGKLITKLEKISEIETTPQSYSGVSTQLKKVYNSPEFKKIKEIVKSIPKNQQKKFLKNLLAKLDSYAISARDYLNYHMPSVKNSENIIALDQAFYQFHLIVELLKKELSGKPNIAKFKRLTSGLFFLIVKINGFIRKKVSSDELLQTISFLDSEINIRDSGEYKDYLYALTN